MDVPREAKELVLACLQLRPQDRPPADLVRDKCWQLQRRVALASQAAVGGHRQAAGGGWVDPVSTAAATEYGPVKCT